MKQLDNNIYMFSGQKTRNYQLSHKKTEDIGWLQSKVDSHIYDGSVVVQGRTREIFLQGIKLSLVACGLKILVL